MVYLFLSFGWRGIFHDENVFYTQLAWIDSQSSILLVVFVVVVNFEWKFSGTDNIVYKIYRLLSFIVKLEIPDCNTIYSTSKIYKDVFLSSNVTQFQMSDVCKMFIIPFET